MMTCDKGHLITPLSSPPPPSSSLNLLGSGLISLDHIVVALGNYSAVNSNFKAAEYKLLMLTFFTSNYMPFQSKNT